MNINKFLVKAKEADIDVSEIKISKTTSSSISIFRGEIDLNLLVIDGQGGQLGSQIIRAIRARYNDINIIAIS